MARGRRRRLALRGRAGVTLAVAAMAIAAGGAVAQDSPSTTGGAGATSSASGASVSAIQQALGIPADGVYGPKTRSAVRRFQRREGLAVDGVAGPATLAALGVGGQSADTSGTTENVSNPTPEADPSTGDTSASATLQRIAQCESGGNPTAISADGQYRGKYQFDRATWAQFGGTGDPAQAPEAEQDRIAAALLAARGTAPWPVCG